jgi:hypothetical protein
VYVIKTGDRAAKNALVEYKNADGEWIPVKQQADSDAPVYRFSKNGNVHVVQPTDTAYPIRYKLDPSVVSQGGGVISGIQNGIQNTVSWVQQTLGL